MATRRTVFGIVTFLLTTGLLLAGGSGNLVWTTRTPMPTARYALGAVAGANGKIYAAGGWNLGPQNAMEEYDAAHDTWTRKASMSSPRANIGMAAAGDGTIYVIGGYPGGSAPVATVEAYNPASNTWSYRAPLSGPRYTLAAVVASDGKVYAIGGATYNFGPGVATVEAYDPASNTWTMKAPMLTARRYFAAVAAGNGKIYAIGGCTSGWCNGPADILKTVEEYDPDSNTWLTKSPMAIARADATAVAAPDGRIYVIGGGNTSGTLTSVEAYDPATDTWAFATPTPIARSGAGAAVGDGRIYVMGGIGMGGLLATLEEASWAAPPNGAPTAAATFVQVAGTGPGCTGLILLDGSRSTDPDGDALTFVWTEDGSTIATGQQPEAVVLSVGSHTITLTVDDGHAHHASHTLTVVVDDRAAPSFMPRASTTLEATGPGGAFFDPLDGVTVTDNCDANPAIMASPAAGNFAMGSTTVTYTASDHASPANTTIISGTVVTVRDTTAPILSNVPANITTNATMPAGATVTYAPPTATDAVGVVTQGCVPSPGSTVAVGVTVVVCTAADAAGNSAVPASFTVTVRSAMVQLDDLLALVTGVGPGRSLAAKVLSARAALAAGDTAAAASYLQDLINEVNAQTGKSLLLSTASQIIEVAQRIRGALGY